MVCVFVDCFIGIWTVFAFPSQTAFQYVRQVEMHFSRFARVRRYIARRSLKLETGNKSNFRLLSKCACVNAVNFVRMHEHVPIRNTT